MSDSNLILAAGDPCNEGHHDTARLCRAFFNRPVATVARDLVGVTLLFHRVGGVIVEAEAYDDKDPASHSVNGMTARNRSMFGMTGHAYVYRSYGLHWCLNVVCGTRPGGAVLIRALEPCVGLEAMRARRPGMRDAQLCAGPGRLCTALGIDGGCDGLDLQREPFWMTPTKIDAVISTGPRIGISRAADVPWRFGIAGSAYLSTPFGHPE